MFGVAPPELAIGAVAVTAVTPPGAPLAAEVTWPSASTVIVAFVYVPAATPLTSWVMFGVVPPELAIGAVAVTDVTGAVPLAAEVTWPSASTVTVAFVEVAAATPRASWVMFGVAPPELAIGAVAVTDVTGGAPLEAEVTWPSASTVTVAWA